MSHGADNIRCEVLWKLSEEKKTKEIQDHVLNNCIKCVTNPRRLYNGKEMLFPDALPPWIKIPESEVKNPSSWKKYERKKVNVQMAPEEFEQFLVDSDMGDEAMVFEICKFMRIERLAAWPKLREIRVKQKEVRIQQEKEEKMKKKKEAEAKKEAEKLKKSDEKRKSTEAKKQKEDEKQEYLEKMNEEERMLHAVLGASEDVEETTLQNTSQDSEETQEEGPRFKKEFNLRAQMPWQPSVYDLLCFEQRSAVDQVEQKRMIAMCQNLMNFGGFQHVSNRRELKDIRQASSGEYESLVSAAIEHAKKETFHPIDFICFENLFTTIQAIHRKTPDPTNYLFQKPAITIENRSSEGMEGIRSEQQATMPKLERVLKTSRGCDILTIPDMTKRCEISGKQKLRTPREMLKNDVVAKKLLKTTPSVHVAMDATTACHLLAPNWESREYEFGIQIVVRNEKVNGEMKKMVVLGKPVPYETATNSTMQRMALKRMLKNQFVQAYNFYLEKPKEPEKQAEEVPESIPETSESAGLLDDLFAEITKTQKTSKKEDELSIETGYQYSLFNCASRKLLIRSRPPYQIQEAATDKRKVILENKKVTFEPRVEYLPSGGAMDLSAEEWVWNYTKRLMKQSDAHLLYRTSYKLDNVLQIDAISVDPKICEPPPLALAILTTRTIMLEELLTKLEALEVGEYLAYQQTTIPNDDPEAPTEPQPKKPLIVLPKCESPNGVSTESMKLTKKLIKTQAAHIGNDWFHGFSPEVAFQWQIVQGRAPRLLLAKDSPMQAIMPSRNSVDKLQRKKNTIKRKFDKIADAKSNEKRNKLDLDDPNLFADFTNPAVLSASRDNRNHNNWRGKHRGRGKPRGRGGNWRGAGRKPKHFQNSAGPAGPSTATPGPFSP